MTITNRIQLNRGTNVFVKKEADPGTMNYPTADDLIVISGTADFNQQPSFTESTEVRDSRSLKDRFRDKNPAGSWSLPMYCRPSGTKGSKPDGAALLEAAFGVETISAGSSVTYSLTKDDLPCVTAAYEYKDMVFAVIGASVNEMRSALANKGAINFTFSGGFMEMKWAGKAEIASHAAGVVTLDTENDTKKFTVGMKVKFYDVDTETWFDNSGAGYSITAVDITAKQVTVSPTVSEFTPAADDIMQGWLPTGTEVGTPIAARKGTCEFDDGPINILSMDFVITNNVIYEEDEISATDYPSEKIDGNRRVTTTTTLYLRTNDLKYFRDALDEINVKVAMKGGDTDGKKIELTMPQCTGSVPAISGDLQKQISVDWTALASATLEDEVSLKFI